MLRLRSFNPRIECFAFSYKVKRITFNSTHKYLAKKTEKMSEAETQKDSISVSTRIVFMQNHNME